MKKKAIVLALALLSLGAAARAFAQEIQVSRTNRTVSVTVTETVQVDPEIGVVEIGYHNYGRTQEQAYEENLRAADKITKALSEAGIPKQNIETQAVSLQRVETEDKDWTAEQRKERQFEAHQSWKMSVPVAEAQKVVDLAVSTGVNEVRDVEWTVSDPKVLEARASAAALAQARGTAERMAQQLGAKLGELLYVGNTLQDVELVTRPGLARTITVEAGLPPPPPPPLKLFPRKVQREASIYVVFSLE